MSFDKFLESFRNSGNYPASLFDKTAVEAFKYAVNLGKLMWHREFKLEPSIGTFECRQLIPEDFGLTTFRIKIHRASAKLAHWNPEHVYANGILVIIGFRDQLRPTLSQVTPVIDLYKRVTEPLTWIHVEQGDFWYAKLLSPLTIQEGHSFRLLVRVYNDLDDRIDPAEKVANAIKGESLVDEPVPIGLCFRASAKLRD